MKTILLNIKKHLIIYIVAIILVPIALCLTFELKTKTPKKEIFSIFITSNEIHREEMVSSFNDIIINNGITELTIFNESPETNLLYDDELFTKGIAMSDLLIVPESKLNENFALNNLHNYKYLVTNGLNYGEETKQTFGLKIFDNTIRTSPLDEFINFEYKEENYYLVISSNSYHYSDYISNDDSLLKSMIDWFVNYGK